MSSVPLVRDPYELQALLEERRRSGARVGFVPTMGALHDGHLRLAAHVRPSVDVLVASVFVNPTQFGPGEDFARYPRDLGGDAQKLAGVGVDLLFAPERDSMYLPGDATRVRVERLTAHLCGPFRPGHFEGVATVVTKLFALVGPCRAAFGRKDFQQLAVIRRMTSDLFLPVVLDGVPIVRESDGLAMSSRNAFLSPEDRQRARALPEALKRAALAYRDGERDPARLVEHAAARLREITSRIDYVSVVDAGELAPIDLLGEEPALLAIACYLGNTRLIDNFVFGEDSLASLSGAK